ncbi:MAG: Serine/threonine protein kinase [Actinoallomurus sp.]|jgi:hypothetical protein|nr:Serine/threonine protein kinase [Actinoallomurus sp.]
MAYRLVERYRLVSVLGAGGMGTVWRAYDELLGRDVAIKRIELAEDAPPDERAMLCARAAREARATVMLDHPGIVTVHDVVEPDGRPWIIMELVEGRSLDQVVAADGPLPPRRVAEIGLRLVDALTAAHEKGLLHRDVKPANVLLAEDGRIVLTDFGIAALDGDPALTRTGTLVGSPGFIAPERLRDEVAGPASDLWSLGATLYAAVEGRAPFDHAASLAALGAVLTEEAPPPGRAGALAPVLTLLLDKDPATRISATEARAALGRVAAGGDSGLGAAPSMAPPADPPPGAQPAARSAALYAATEPAGQPVARPRERPQRRRPVLAGAVVAVTVVAVPASAPLGHGTDQGPVRSAARGAPHPVSSVDTCALLTDLQASGVLADAVRRRDVPRTGDCAWQSPKVAAMLTIYKPKAVAASFDEGRDRMAIERNEQLSLMQQARTSPLNMSFTWPYDGYPKFEVHMTEATELTDLKGVGDEAVTYTDHGSVQYDEVNITLREGNVVLQLQWAGPRNGPAAAASGARRAAVAIARTLARLENRE